MLSNHPPPPPGLFHTSTSYTPTTPATYTYTYTYIQPALSKNRLPFKIPRSSSRSSLHPGHEPLDERRERKHAGADGDADFCVVGAEAGGEAEGGGEEEEGGEEGGGFGFGEGGGYEEEGGVGGAQLADVERGPFRVEEYVRVVEGFGEEGVGGEVLDEEARWW